MELEYIDETDETTTDRSAGEEVAIAFASAAAAAAGTVVGMMAINFIAGKAMEIRRNRLMAKDQKNQTEDN